MEKEGEQHTLRCEHLSPDLLCFFLYDLMLNSYSLVKFFHHICKKCPVIYNVSDHKSI